MSVTYCRKCQGLIEAGQPFCSRCFTPINQPSLLRRAFRRLIEWCGGAIGVSGGKSGSNDHIQTLSSTKLAIETNRRYSVHDQASGEVRQHVSIDDLPPELREAVAAVEKDGVSDDRHATVTRQSITRRITTQPGGTEHQEVVVRDNDGNERRYTSIDELPPELRGLLDRCRDI